MVQEVAEQEQQLEVVVENVQLVQLVLRDLLHPQLKVALVEMEQIYPLFLEQVLVYVEFLLVVAVVELLLVLLLEQVDQAVVEQERLVVAQLLVQELLIQLEAEEVLVQVQVVVEPVVQVS